MQLVPKERNLRFMSKELQEQNVRFAPSSVTAVDSQHLGFRLREGLPETLRQLSQHGLGKVSFSLAFFTTASDELWSCQVLGPAETPQNVLCHASHESRHQELWNRHSATHACSNTHTHRLMHPCAAQTESPFSRLLFVGFMQEWLFSGDNKATTPRYRDRWRRLRVFREILEPLPAPKWVPRNLERGLGQGPGVAGLLCGTICTISWCSTTRSCCWHPQPCRNQEGGKIPSPTEECQD